MRRPWWLTVVIILTGGGIAEAQTTAVGATVGSMLNLFAGDARAEVGGHVERRLVWRTAIRGDVALLERPAVIGGGRLTRVTATGLYRNFDRPGQPYTGIAVSLYLSERDAGSAPGERRVGAAWLIGDDIRASERWSIPVEMQFRAGEEGLGIAFSLGLRRWR
jgi:hypothetical protein